MLINPTKIAFCIILTETSIYLAYYKDIIFSSLVLANFVGMLSFSYNIVPHGLGGIDGATERSKQMLTWLSWMATFTAVLTFSVYFFDLDAAFYLKGKAYYNLRQ